MTAITADFEKGSNGATIAITDPGSATAWDVISITSGASITYDNTHPAHGVLGAHLFTGASGASPSLSWTAAFPDSTVIHYGRFYFYATNISTDLTSTIGQPIQINNNAGARAGRVCIGNDGKVRLLDQAASIRATSTTVLSSATLYRIEYQFVHNATTGSVQALIYAGDSTTPLETVNATNINTSTEAGSINIGYLSSGLVNGSLWLDQIVAAATAYPGPFPVNSVAPVVSGSSLYGSVLSCDGGVWGGTFTLSYQWTQDGVPIIGQTASTYTTQIGDVGHVIGCTVTATGQQATNESAAQASGNTVAVVAPPQILVPQHMGRMRP